MEIRDHLLQVGVPADALTVWNLPESMLAYACDRAGDRLAAEIDSPVSRIDLSPESIANACPDFKDSNRSGDQAVVRLLMGLPGSLRPARSANHLSNGLSGAPLYILATADSLWEAVITT